MTQIINFNNKLFLEEKFKIYTPNELTIEYDFNKEEKYLNIGNKLILKIIKVKKKQKYNKEDIFQPQQNHKNDKEYEIIITYDDRQNSIFQGKAISIKSNSNNSNKTNKEKAISIDSKYNNLSKEKDYINYVIYKDKQNQKQIKNDVKNLRKNLLNKNPIVEYNNSSLSTTFQINEEELKKSKSCNQSNVIIELHSDSEEPEIKGIERISSKSEEISIIQKNKIYENIKNTLINKKRKRSIDKKDFYIYIDNNGIDFNKYESMSLEQLTPKVTYNNNKKKKGKKKKVR